MAQSDVVRHSRRGSPIPVGRALSRLALLACGALIALPEAGSGQHASDRGQYSSLANYREGRWGTPIRSGLPEVPGGFTLCRLQYTVVRNMPSGAGWSTDYPRGEFNLTTRLGELTTTWTSRWLNEDPGIAVVQPTNPDLFRCPFLLASDPGSGRFDEADVAALEEYFRKGGMLWVDDFWGEAAWSYWTDEITKVLPDLPIVDLPMDHPLMSIVYHVERVPQIPNIQFWRRSGGGTSEFGAETAEPHMRAIFDHDGRLLVLMTHNTDIADGWEREMDDDTYFQFFSPDAYAVGINVLIWAMTH